MYTFIHKKHPYIHAALFAISFLTLQALEQTRKDDCSLFLDVTFSYFITTVVTRSMIDFAINLTNNEQPIDIIGPAGTVFLGGLFLFSEDNGIPEVSCEILGLDRTHYLTN